MDDSPDDDDDDDDGRGKSSPGNGRSRLGVLPALALVPLSLLATWTILVAAHSPALDKGTAALADGRLSPPDPLTCDPGTCWDGASKYGFPRCTVGSGQRVLGRTIPRGSSTCYKSIVINYESNTVVLVAVVICFITFFSRSSERLFRLMWERRLRYPVFFALLANLFPLYYSFKLVFIYINEFIHHQLASQLFFSTTEITTAFILLKIARKPPEEETNDGGVEGGEDDDELGKEITAYYLKRYNKKRERRRGGVTHEARSSWMNLLPPRVEAEDALLVFARGQALAHCAELILDESRGGAELMTVLRNPRDLFFLLGDLTTILVTVKYDSKTLKRGWFLAFLVALVEIIVFQVMFADSSSYSLLW